MFRHDPGSNIHKITTTLLVVSIDVAGIVDDIVAAGGGVNGEIIVVVAVVAVVVGVVPSAVGVLPHFCYCLCISLIMCLIKLTVMMISNQKS